MYTCKSQLCQIKEGFELGRVSGGLNYMGMLALSKVNIDPF